MEKFIIETNVPKTEIEEALNHWLNGPWIVNFMKPQSSNLSIREIKNIALTAFDLYEQYHFEKSNSEILDIVLEEINKH